MTMMAFHHLFPAEAREEGFAVTAVGNRDLPPHTFLFVEAYCVERSCDCRRVLISVMDADSREQVATINHAFEKQKGPFEDEPLFFLDPMNPQSDLSPALLRLFENVIREHPEYAARLRRHYAMWKAVVNDPSHPAQKILSGRKPSWGISPNRVPPREQRQKVGAKDPCPCGSGRKYKRCCRN
ncbi:MAG: SEC-C metal-binding domain-containing protein [Kofleriaceae bacterium]|nr:SEC-C metal-binding domain-containing protein [Kofleriaceae bacterium]